MLAATVAALQACRMTDDDCLMERKLIDEAVGMHLDAANLGNAAFWQVQAGLICWGQTYCRVIISLPRWLPV